MYILIKRILIKHFFYSGSGQTIKMQTENLGVVYYVNKDFKNEYKGMLLQKVEKSVEEDYVTNIRNNCWKERQQSKYIKCLIFKNLFMVFGIDYYRFPYSRNVLELSGT